MTTAQINLTDSQTDALHELARLTGKTEDELLQEAVKQLIEKAGEAETKRQEWLHVLRQAKGIWKDRKDLPDLREMRKEADDRISKWSDDR